MVCAQSTLLYVVAITRRTFGFEGGGSIIYSCRLNFFLGYRKRPFSTYLIRRRPAAGAAKQQKSAGNDRGARLGRAACKLRWGGAFEEGLADTLAFHF